MPAFTCNFLLFVALWNYEQLIEKAKISERMLRTSDGFLTISSKVRLRGKVKHSEPRWMQLMISSRTCIITTATHIKWVMQIHQITTFLNKYVDVSAAFFGMTVHQVSLQQTVVPRKAAAVAKALNLYDTVVTASTYESILPDAATMPAFRTDIQTTELLPKPFLSLLFWNRPNTY